MNNSDLVETSVALIELHKSAVEVGVLKGTGDRRAVNQTGHDRHQGTKPDGTPLEDSPGSADGFCLNTMVLRVEPHESFRRVSQFVRALRFDFRLLQMVGNYKEGLAIRLAVRQPLRPEEVLKKLDGVSQIDVPHWLNSRSHEHVLRVRLTGDRSPSQITSGS